MNTRSRFQRFVVMLAAVLFVFGVTAMPTPSYHNIDMVKARDKAREYARKKVDDRNRNYEHFSTDCTPAFEGHNHYARCVIFIRTPSAASFARSASRFFFPLILNLRSG